MYFFNNFGLPGQARDLILFGDTELIHDQHRHPIIPIKLGEVQKCLRKCHLRRMHRFLLVGLDPGFRIEQRVVPVDGHHRPAQARRRQPLELLSQCPYHLGRELQPVRAVVDEVEEWRIFGRRLALVPDVFLRGAERGVGEQVGVLVLEVN